MSNKGKMVKELEEMLKSQNEEHNKILKEISYEDNEKLLQLGFTIACVQDSMRIILENYDVENLIAIPLYVIDGTLRHSEMDLSGNEPNNVH